MTQQVPLNSRGLPKAQGLYDPENEHDSCGIGFLANIKGKKSHSIVKQGLQILENLTHRGAVGADPLAGDGAGILLQIPDAFMRAETKKLKIKLPKEGEYGILMVFLPHDEKIRAKIKKTFEKLVAQEGQKFLGWRKVPTDNSKFSENVKSTEPRIEQGFVGQSDDITRNGDLELKLFIIRKQLSNIVMGMDKNTDAYYSCSCSSRTVLYKGMLLAGQVGEYYEDLSDERVVSGLALVHQRFSTNTFPTWSLAQPFRMICHNGEINTVRGNVNWMASRRFNMQSRVIGDDLAKLWPLIPEGLSDTACFDNALELLVAGGYSIMHAMMMLIPEAWAGNPLMNAKRKAFYEYHAALMEPWDGPAAVAFTDGIQIGATLDRNGLRPARYIVTDDDMVILASESGVLPIKEENIVQKWRLQPGKMLLIDTQEGRIISDDEIKNEMADAFDYQDILNRTQIKLEELPSEVAPHPASGVDLLKKQQAFGYTQEDLKLLFPPMVTSGQEALGSMGTDTPISALSDKSKLLYTYFKQNFAQVTNPPIDPIREEAVMSLVSFIGPRPNLLDLEGHGTHKRLEVSQPILRNQDLEKIRTIGDIPDNDFRTITIDTTYAAKKGAKGIDAAIDSICLLAEVAVIEGDNIIILSDRNVSEEKIALPALLATSAVHHYLIRKGLRTSVGLVVETGEAREVHHFCALAGYGAEAINPYLAFETIENMLPQLPEEVSVYTAKVRYVKAINKGILKVMSKMGISTYQSYCGAQVFDAVGLNSAFVSQYFTSTKSAIEGVGLKEVAKETVMRHRHAFGDNLIYKKTLDVGGDYAVRMRGEAHQWNSETITSLQHAVRGNAQEKYDQYAALVNEQSEKLMTPRGLFNIKPVGKKIPLKQVESAANIVKRFATGAMSFGSISREAHTNLAIAMNKIGGKSNTGEGGEEPDRFTPDRNGDLRRSAIKQVASGRFGVTTEYLVNADDIQIKMAQGAKPGEGGQLPGHKVDPVIAKVRHSTTGVGLISPPPHHDIYSIEDLAQLIYDLKNVNPIARISVKLVSEIGVGTVAAGVSKAKADHVTISGFDGGTGASPLTSVKHAGSPWEIGLAETQQTLVLNRLRDRIAVQVDGGLKTGRDVIIGALLGADEFGFATAPLIASGCIMMRKCHLNTCPVGVATQDPVLRRKFTGKPEHVVNYFFFVAEEARKIMAEMGARTMDEIIGRSDLLDKNNAISHWKSDGLDFTKLFHKNEAAKGDDIYNTKKQVHDIVDILDRKLIKKAKDALENKTPVQIKSDIHNYDRSTGAMLSGELAKRYGLKGLRNDTIHIKLNGIAGQSFGAFVAQGITFELEGEANDYVGKGLSGGKLIIYPPKESKIVPEQSIIVGNTVLFGAISGECYFHGVAGERFAVRNSGAIAVVEGVGDHGCEYMTGGCVVVIGPTGRNFAAGMSGGIAYVLDEEGEFENRCNLSMVELEPLPEEDEMAKLLHASGELEGHGRVDVLRGNMSGYDKQRLVQLLENHVRYTNSERAKTILNNIEDYLPKFVKVMPVEYKRALEEMAAAATSLSAYTGGGE
ncbi:MAG: glutamate synthase large subunit [Kordiimonadaceae bacterium]|jgi:glutamate synthase (NADPH) large chain|nr:glutamate synthase large subunit [Kordiimonadaceae bacterium]MBT6035021.1 glutamate synthase large subunit [Kordiimonadaceae bacterium]